VVPDAAKNVGRHLGSGLDTNPWAHSADFFSAAKLTVSVFSFYYNYVDMKRKKNTSLSVVYKIHNWCAKKHVVKFEASSASLIPPSHMTATPPSPRFFLKNMKL